MKPKVSVLLPVRDGAATIADALRSLQAQTLREVETIVVDDGSRDGTADLLARFQRRDPRIVVLRQRPLGIVAALNRAASAARAPLLARMDADDLSHPRRLARQISWLQRRSDLAAVGTLVASFNDAGPTTEGWRRYEQWLNARRTTHAIARDLLVESPLAHPSVMMRKRDFEAVGGYRNIDGPEDYDLWLRMALRGGRFAKVPEVLLRWRDHDGRLTRTDPRYRTKAFIRLKVDYLLQGPLRLRKQRPLLVWGAGRYGGPFGRALQARSIHIDAFVDISPRRIGKTKCDRPVIAPSDIARFGRPMVLGAVPLPEARPRIRRQLTRIGLVEGVDYWICG